MLFSTGNTLNIHEFLIIEVKNSFNKSKKQKNYTALNNFYF